MKWGGKLPPQAIDLEGAVIGAAMQFKESASQMVELMTRDMLYVEANKLLFDTIKGMFMRGDMIDILTVVQQLRKEGSLDRVGGAFAVSGLTNISALRTSVESYIRIIIQKYISRQIITISSEMIDKAYNDETDVFDLLASFESTISNMYSNVVKTDYKNMKELVKTINEEIGARTKSTNYTHGIASTIKSVNNIVGGWGKTDMIIIAARPAMGKSAFVVSEVRNAARNGTAVGVFSLEMSGEQFAYRIAAQETGIDLEILMKKQMDEGRLTHLYGNLGVIENLPVYIDDTGGLSIFDFKARARRMKSKHNVGMIVIDYLQLMTTGNDNGKGNREQEVSLISRTIKSLAKELDVPIIALSQLSRQVEARSDKRPLLSDLRESGCLIGDTMIYSQHDKKIVRIEDLVGRKKLHTFAFSKNKTMELKVKNAWITGVAPVFKIELLNGMSIEATANHKFLTDDGWERCDLLNGKSIAIPISYESDNPLDPSDAEARFLGHFISNGSAISKQPLRYTNNVLDADLAELVIKDAIECCGRVAPYTKRNKTGNSECLVTFFKPTFHLTHGKTSPVADFMRRYGLFDKRAKDKFIPDEVFFWSNKKASRFLSALFAGDGTVSLYEKGGRKSLKISYSTSSEKLAFGVQQLLAKCGVIAFKSRVENKKKQVWWHVYISGKSNIEQYVRHIGFASKRKNDTMMNGWDVVKDSLAGWSKHDFNENRTLCFMPVKSITPMGEKEVFDMEVPVANNFIANGILAHNSLEQDADIVAFLYRPEYYGIHQNEEGETTVGYGEFLVGKNRHGKTGVAKMKFTDYLALYSDQNTGYNTPHPDITHAPSTLTANTNFVNPKDESPF